MWMRSGIQRFWFWLCSRLLSSQRLLAAALFLRSAWSAFIRPLNLLKCCLFFSCLLTLLLGSGIKPVYAQCPGPGCPTPVVTNTPRPPNTPQPPTPTFSPLFPTETQGPTPDYSCPTGQPVGAGVVTPNPSWKLNCGHCLTPVPGYVWATIPPPEATFDWDAYFDATAGPAATITPNALPPTPTFSPNAITAKSNSSGEQYSTYIQENLYPNTAITRHKAMVEGTGNMNTGYDWTIPITTSLKTFVIGVSVSGTYTIQTKADDYSGIYGYFNYRFAREEGTNNTTKVDIIASDVPGLVAGSTFSMKYSTIIFKNYLSPSIHIPLQKTQTFNLIFNVTITKPTWGSESQDLFFSTYVSGSTAYANSDWTVSWQNGPMSAPVPPPPASNCSAINGVGAPGDPDNLFNSRWFSLPYIGIGVGQCFGLEPITINLTFLQTFVQSLPDSISTPGFEICLVPVAFGSLNFFGIPVDLDSWAIVLSAVLMFKVLTRF